MVRFWKKRTSFTLPRVLIDQLETRETPVIFNGNDYRLTSTQLPWDQAQAAAQAAGGRLVTIETLAEETFIKNTFGTSEQFWVGLTDKAIEGQFVWSNGSVVTHANWSFAQPDNFNNEDYVAMNYGSDKGWNDYSANTWLRGVIEIDLNNDDPINTGGNVPVFDGNKYYRTTGPATWQEAQAQAVALGGHLVTVDSAAEEAFIKTTFGASESYWIGLTDAGTEGQYKWASGLVRSYVNWGLGQPDNFNNEDFVAMNFGADQKWNDFGADATLRGIIEVDVAGDDAGNTQPNPTFNGFEYFLTSAPASWNSAQAEAVTAGGNLASVISAAENNFLKSAFGTNESFWIGLNDAAAEGTYRWVSNETVSFTDWSIGQPDNFNNEDYVGTNFGSDQKWNDYGVGTQLRGIIKRPLGSAGGFSLASSVYTVNENGGSVTVTVQRTNGTAGTANIEYATVNASATAGSDFTARTGTLTFAPGETQKTVSIPIIDDTVVEGSETFNFTIDFPTGGATLLAPRTATITVLDNESGLPKLIDYDNFSNSVTLKRNGSAVTTSAGVLQLTQNAVTLAGSAYHRNLIEVNNTVSFNARFSFRITGGTNGADGLTFVLQNAPAGLSALGGAGGALGYDGIGQSVAVEFDTYQNPTDTNANNVSILRLGNTTTPISTALAGLDLNSGSTLYAWVDYSATNNLMSVFLAGSATKPTTALVSASVNLSATVGAQMLAGFTAATGGASNAHEILDFEFNANTRLLPPPPDAGNVVAQTLYTGFVQPTSLDWSPDGRNLYVSEQRGIIRVVRDGVLQATPFLDFQDRINGTRDRGLLDIAVHPDFVNNPYVYLIYTYDPPEVYSNVGNGNAGPDGVGNRAGRITRVTANAATNYTTIVPNSEVVLVGKNSTWANFDGFANSTNDFNEPPAGILPDGSSLQDFIATDSESHTVGSLEFGPDGNLYATIGDGTSYNRVDPRTVRVQDINNLSGKVLRINPITGAGLTSNPFYDGNANSNRSKVYQYGVRNAFRAAFDDLTGRFYIGDVGWGTWEEINSAGAGANFGWPYYEGASGTSARTGGYQDLPQAQAFYASGAAVVPSILALNHSTDGINAIVMGDVYRGTAYPSSYEGDLFFNDLGQGIVRNVSFDAVGNITQVQTFTTGARYVVQIKQGPDGFLYFVDLDDGQVGRWILQ